VQAQPIQLQVDASTAANQIIHIHEIIPVSAGSLALYYPQWIPGEHSPAGPINNLLEVHFKANGQELAWLRDDVDMYEFHLDVPAGASQIEADFVDANDPNTNMNPYFARVSWHRDLLYPGGKTSDETQVVASAKLPSGWQYATALPVDHEDGQTIYFKEASLSTLVDSPILTGKYFNKVKLLEEPPHELDIAADNQAATVIAPEVVAELRKMVIEEYATFKAHHYRDYHFLITFSNFGGYMGLEHHECSEDGMGLNGAKDVNYLGYLLCHEFTHSWNGKYRRPVGLATPNFEVPMRGDLLWVYEGLTEYVGTVLAPRSGLWTPDTFKEALASIGALLDTQQGRDWRPVEDTAISAHGLVFGDWGAERRAQDYYYEAVLVWLEADVKIRQMSGGQKSLDDFLRAFHGPPSTDAPIVKSYTYEDIVSTLNQVQAYDWDKFLKDRFYTVQTQAPLGGIEESGWKLVYTDQPNNRWVSQYGGGGGYTRLTLGLMIPNGDGKITDTIIGMPGEQAGLCPGMQIITVNGKAYTPGVLLDAIKAAQPIQVQVDFDGAKSAYSIQYTGGVRIPHLVRDQTKADLLTTIISPHVISSNAP
jgi:predicted metalloprotease with PDZ domain